MHDDTLDGVIPAVIYAAKSTADKRGSIPTQVEDCRAAIERAGRGLHGEPQTDEGFSAYKRSRGPGLETAKRLAIEAAAEHGDAEIWVQHSDRLARGDGITADHLAEPFFSLRRQCVRLRSVQDDSTFENAVLAVVMGERNTEDSRRKSEATRAGKRRRFERGQSMGGPVTDGYRIVVDATGSRYEIDEERASLVRTIFERALNGESPATIARALNAAGHRTAVRTSKRSNRTYGGKPWTRRRVHDTLTTPLYAGRVVFGRGRVDQEVRDGTQPAIVEPEPFDEVQAMLAARNPSPEHERRRGRPPLRYALAGLAQCARCGSTMYSVTSGWKRKDGTRGRSYVCANVRTATGTCDAPPVDAEMLDRAVVAHLDGFFLDFDGWLAEVTDRRSQERDRIEGEVSVESGELRRLDRLAGLIRADYARQLEAGDQGAAKVASEALADSQGQREAVERRLRRLEGALTAVPEETPADALLDLYNDLSAAVKGNGGSAPLAEVNARLREVFEVFPMDTLEPEGTVLVEPRLCESAVARWREGYLAVAGANRAVDPELRESERGPIGMLVSGEERIVPPVKALETEACAKGRDTLVWGQVGPCGGAR